MIMKANKQIGFIYKNNESIDKILKDGDVVFERGFLRERTSTTLPITFGGVGKDLKDYKIYGNTVQSKLPSGYTQVDYIESSGTQYIDTGVNADSNLDIDVKMAIIPSSGTSFMGAMSNNFDRYHFDIQSSNAVGIWLVTGNAGRKNLINDGTIATRYKIFPTQNYYEVDGVQTSNTFPTIDTEQTFWLFGRHYTTPSYAKVKLYDFKMYYNGILARDFIPCYRNSNNEVGLYDLVNKVFYTNQGTGTFTYGNVAPTPDTPIEMVSCGDNSTGLPVGYTQVDYIESSGTQYIDTGYKLNGNSEIYTDYMLTSVSPNEIGMIFGARENNDKRGFMFGDASSNNSFPVAYYGEGSTPSSIAKVISTNSESNKKYNLTVKDGKFNISELGTISFTKSTFSLTNSMYIFCGNQNSIPSYKAKARIYKFNIYENDTLTRKFIPCYRNSDNEIGLYDLVNNAFYTNQGTGVFTYGSEIEKGGYKIPVNVNNVITNIYLDEPLRKIDEYSDYIDFINGKVVRNIYEYKITGNENWQKQYGINLFDVQSLFNNNPFINEYGLSNMYKYNPIQSGIDTNTVHGEFALQRSTRGTTRSWNLFIKNTSYSDKDLFKTYLQNLYNNGTPVIINYPLETPTEETITLPNIPTVDGNNTLNIETEITPSQVYIKYKSNE